MENIMSIILPNDFDITKVGYGKQKSLDSGCKLMSLTYKNAGLLSIQTPSMFCPFGVSKYVKEGEREKYSIQVSFKDMEKKASIMRFFENQRAIDEKLIQDGITNSKEWLKKPNASRDVLDALYTHTIKFPVDKETGEVTNKYAPTMKVSMPFKDGKFTFDVYDSYQNQIDITDMDLKGSQITMILGCTVWIAAGKYGVTWKVLQMKVIPKTMMRGYAIRSLDDEEEVAAATTSSIAKKGNNKTVQKDADYVMSSDEEGDDASAVTNDDIDNPIF